MYVLQYGNIRISTCNKSIRNMVLTPYFCVPNYISLSLLVASTYSAVPMPPCHQSICDAHGIIVSF